MTREDIGNNAMQSFFNGGLRGILQIAQRVGKTKIGLNIIKYMLLNDEDSILIAYPDNKIKDSWINEIEKWEVSQYLQIITFVNYSSIYKYEEQEFDLVILDEIHATSDNQRESIQKITSKSKATLGLSGTISYDTEKELMDNLQLPVLMRYTVEQAIQDGIIAPYSIFIHTVDLDTYHKEPNKKGKMISEKQKYDNYTYVIEDLKERGKDFKFLALHRNRVLQNSRSKLYKTTSLLNKVNGRKVIVFTGLKKIAESLGIPYYHSTSGTEDVFEQFKRGDINELAVVNIGRAGVTFPNLDVIIINSFTGNEETSEQVVARALNKDSEEKVGEIHIISSNEPAELKKLQQTLKNFNEEKIQWM